MKNIDRYKHMDLMKALGIIYVVIGHTQPPIRTFIYLFHMALFFFVSGYFYSDKYTSNPIVLIKKRIKTLYFPFLRYELLFLLLHNILYKLNLYDINTGYRVSVTQYTKSNIFEEIFSIATFWNREQLLGVFWFFTVLFLVNIIFCFTRYVILNLFRVKNEYIIFVIILCFFIVGNLLTFHSVYLPRGLNNAFVALLIYYFGFLYKKIEHSIPFNFYLSISCILMLFLNTLYGKVSLGQNTYLSPVFFITNSILGIYFNLHLAKILSSKDMKLLYYIGENTIIIMALHFLCFKLINLLQIYIYNHPIEMIAKFPVLDGSNGWWILYTIVGIFIPVSMKYLSYRIFSSSKK
ncbi:MAG: acyltransferase family protein [Spirochaetota bacterium]|nr:acyltransferase family protein [Spirochaetota bacterium]